MATGDAADFTARLRAALPARWFPDDAPILTGVLAGFATSFSSIYDALAYAKLQTRLLTVTDRFLDFFAADYFGTLLRRRSAEADGPLRARIYRELLRPRNTRAAMVQALSDLTGKVPVIFEFARPGDTGGYNVGGVGYGAGGAYGSLTMPYQAFVTAYRPSGGGLANVGGYYTGSGWAGGGYGVGAIAYASPSDVSASVPDSDIYATIERTKPAGTVMWTQITSGGATAISTDIGVYESSTWDDGSLYG